MGNNFNFQFSQHYNVANRCNYIKVFVKFTLKFLCESDGERIRKNWSANGKVMIK